MEFIPLEKNKIITKSQASTARKIIASHAKNIETIEESVQTEKPASKPRGRKPSVKKEAVKLEVLKETAEKKVAEAIARPIKEFFSSIQYGYFMVNF